MHRLYFSTALGIPPISLGRLSLYGNSSSGSLGGGILGRRAEVADAPTVVLATVRASSNFLGQRR